MSDWSRRDICTALLRPGNRGFVVAVGLFLLLNLALQLFIVGGNPRWSKPPSAAGDSIEYDVIAYSLSEYGTFALAYGDARWQEPYVGANKNQEYEGALHRENLDGPTAGRPPIYPLYLAGIYQLFGRDYLLVRALNLVMTAFATYLVFLVANRHLGRVAGIASLVAALKDPLPVYYSSSVLTEVPSLFALSLHFYLLTLCFRMRGRRRVLALVATFAFGSLLLTLRSSFVFLTPVWLLAALYVPKDQERPLKRIALQGLGLLLVLLIGPAIWGVRNGLASGKFMPFGSQGPRAAVYIFSPEAVQGGGIWWHTEQLLVGRGYFQREKLELGGGSFESLPLLDREIKQGERRLSEFKGRVLADPFGFLRLFFVKVQSVLWTHAHSFQIWTITFLVLACFLQPSKAMRRGTALNLAILTLLASVVGIGLTWNVLRMRFLVPIHPILWFGVGAFLNGLVHRICGDKEEAST